MDNRDIARAWQLGGVEPDDWWSLRGAGGQYWLGYAWGYVSHVGGWAG